MPDATPARPPRRQGLACPSCNGEEFTERSSFKTASEPLLGSESAGVVVDLMSCKRCGTDIPAVRGRRRYILLSKDKLSSLVADLGEAQRLNSEMQNRMTEMEARSHSIDIEISRCRAEGEVTLLEARVAALEGQNATLEGRRARLAEALQFIGSRLPAKQG